MDVPHKHGRHNAPKQRCRRVNPQISLINFSVNAQRIHVANLIGGLCDAESRVETTPRDGSSKGYHGVKCQGNGSCLQCSIDTVLNADDDLAQVAKCIEERALKFEQEYFDPLIIIVIY